MTTAHEEDPHATLGELVAGIRAQLGSDLHGLYLFGSLATGDFYPGRSDLDLIAVLGTAINEPLLGELRVMHEEFEAARPAWRDRVEVLYLSRAVLATFAAKPRGRVTRLSPGEPIHFRELDGDMGWLLDWDAVLLADEPLVGPPPREIGPDVPRDRFREAVTAQLREMQTLVRDRTVAYVPAQQGYIAATVCRGLYSLATGEQTSKERAIAWVADRQPAVADYLWSAYNAYRADVRGPHERLIGFVDSALREVEG
jgi:predicted nucleotidyltransferase